MAAIGKLKQVVKFFFDTPTALGAGKKDVFQGTADVTTKGYLKNQSGNRSLSFGDLTLDARSDLWVRYQSALTNVKESTKIVIGTRVFKIQDTERVDERNQFLHFVIAEHKT